MSTEQILADYEAMMDELWAKAGTPNRYYMPKSQAEALGCDVTGLPDGYVVCLEEGRGLSVLEIDDAPSSSLDIDVADNYESDGSGR